MESWVHVCGHIQPVPLNAFTPTASRHFQRRATDQECDKSTSWCNFVRVPLRRNSGREVSPSNLCQNHVGSCIQGCHPKKNAEDCKFQTRTYPEIALTWAETLPRCLL